MSHLHVGAVSGQPAPVVTIEDLRPHLTCSVEIAALALGIGRSAAYAAVRRDEIPHLRIGNRLLIKVPALLELVGASAPEHTEAGSSTEPATA